MCHQALVFAPPTGAPTRPREPASVEDSAAQAADDRSTPGAGSPATAPFSFTAVAADTLQQPLVGAVPVDAMEGLRIQHISAMDLYADRQPEELRWHDYSVPPPLPGRPGAPPHTSAMITNQPSTHNGWVSSILDGELFQFTL